jgi:hypothetical protein
MLLLETRSCSDGAACHVTAAVLMTVSASLGVVRCSGELLFSAHYSPSDVIPEPITLSLRIPIACTDPALARVTLHWSEVCR